MFRNNDEDLLYTDDFRSARRRLVKGSFAVPTVLTVLSGRALALTTAQQRSLAKDVSQTQLPAAVTDPPSPTDTWIRARAYVGQGAGNAQFIPASRLPPSAPGQTSFMTGGQALCVVGGGSYNKGTIYPDGTRSVPVSNGTDTLWYAVLFDLNGRVAGIANVYVDPASAAALGAVHRSVWSSFIL